MKAIIEVGIIPSAYRNNVYPTFEIRSLKVGGIETTNRIIFESRFLVPISRQEHTFLVSVKCASSFDFKPGTFNSEREYEQQKKQMFIAYVLKEVENLQRYYVVDSNVFFDVNGEPIVWELIYNSVTDYR